MCIGRATGRGHVLKDGVDIFVYWEIGSFNVIGEAM